MSHLGRKKKLYVAINEVPIQLIYWLLKNNDSRIFWSKREGEWKERVDGTSFFFFLIFRFFFTETKKKKTFFPGSHKRHMKLTNQLNVSKKKKNALNIFHFAAIKK